MDNWQNVYDNKRGVRFVYGWSDIGRQIYEAIREANAEMDRENLRSDYRYVKLSKRNRRLLAEYLSSFGEVVNASIKTRIDHNKPFFVNGIEILDEDAVI